MSLVAVQHEHPSDPRRDVPGILDRAARSVAEGGLAVLPEYFYKPAGVAPTLEAFEGFSWVEEAVLEASRETKGALVATVPRIEGGQLFNAAIVAEDGGVRLEQPKVYPTAPEREAGVKAGEGLAVAKVQGMRVGVLVCADVLALDLVAELAGLGPDVVAVPVLSPNRDEDVTRGSRGSVFVARAWDMGAYVVKAGGFQKPGVVGRSLITAPWGMLAQAGDEFEATLLGSGFDGEMLEAARSPFVGLGTREG